MLDARYKEHRVLLFQVKCKIKDGALIIKIPFGNNGECIDTFNEMFISYPNKY